MKNIVLLSDGTGNSAAKRHKTNVWRLYQALDLDHPDEQIAFYDDGVGSQQFLPIKLLGSVFGWGLTRNVIDLYVALCRTYKAEDRVYLFGFSRGAFTVRMLAGLISCRGLYTSYTDENDLRRTALQHFRAYRSRHKRGYVHRLLHLFVGRPDLNNLNEKSDVTPHIEFIGAWDTVDAYGFPVYELVRLWDRLICPLRFVDQKLPTKVRHACHALSIDDERMSFRPVLWDERELEDGRVEGASDGLEEEGNDSDGDPRQVIEQVWFAGVHSDVGGGYPRNELARVTFDWMIAKVEAQSADEIRAVHPFRYPTAQ